MPLKRQDPYITRQELRFATESSQASANAIFCPSCHSSYFEQVEVSNYSKLHTVVPGQRVPSEEPFSFYLLRCIKCLELVEPNIQTGMNDSVRKKYNQFLDEMEQEKIDQKKYRPDKV